MMLKAGAKWVFGKLPFTYELYWIMRARHAPNEREIESDLHVRPVNADDLSQSDDDALRTLTSYEGTGATGFGIWEGETLAGVVWYWDPERYMRDRGFIQLKPNELKLVQISIAPDFEGRGLATKLLRYSTHQMFQGFDVRQIKARIWWSHKASLRVFEKAGWRKQYLPVLKIRMKKGRHFSDMEQSM